MTGGRTRAGRALAIGTIGAACSLASPAAAEPGQTGTAQGWATASVIDPLHAVQEQDLSFGAVTASPTTSGEVTVDPSGGTASFHGGAQAACPGTAATICTAHPARFAVSGEALRTYTIDLPDQIVAQGQRTGTSLVVSNLISRSRNRPDLERGGALDLYGKDTFTIGGTLAVPAGTRSDIFRADLPVLVQYQ